MADEEFLLASASSLALLDGQAIERCAGDGAPCAGEGRGSSRFGAETADFEPFWDM